MPTPEPARERGGGIELLRRKRGQQQVTFADVCDHLVDFARRSPEHGRAVEALAAFLANVEDVDHEHRAGEATLEPREARDVPACARSSGNGVVGGSGAPGSEQSHPPPPA